MEVVWEASFAKRYDIEASLDNNRWYTLVDGATGQKGHVTHPLNGTHARFIRLTCRETASYWGCSMFELVVFGRLHKGCGGVDLDDEVKHFLKNIF